jgi:FlaG/FlaF family flagellin (archaellin)
MNKHKRTDHEHAVSPVVGVMLMLVVTIIIAAVVSAFAGGLAGTTSKAPSASIDARIQIDADNGMGGKNSAMTFEHLSGDSILTKDLEIITYYTCPNGTVVKHAQTAASPVVAIYGGWATTRVPFLNSMAKTGGTGNVVAHFGNFTLITGDIMSTGDDVGLSDLLGFDITDPAYNFKAGSVVDMKIVHIPSNKYIIDKEVVVV